MLIKQKLMANTGILVVAMVMMLGLLNFSMGSLESDIETARTIGEFEADVLTLRRHEKDFLSRKKLKYVDGFKKTMVKLNKDLSSMERIFSDSGKDTGEVKQLRNIIKEYNRLFLELSEQQKVIGLDPKDALYGKLREAVHGVEELLGEDDFKLLSDMLQLRRNEKDFMLRLDEKYLDRWQSTSAKFVEDVESSSLSEQNKANVINNISLYQSSFENLVDAQKILGLNEKSGLQGQMRTTVHKVDELVERLVKRSKQDVEDHGFFIDTVSYSASIAILAVAILFAFYVSRSVLQGINLLKSTMRKVSESKDLSLEAKSTANDELAEMANVFNTMIASFRNLIVEVNQSVDTVHCATQSLSENINSANEGVESQIQQTDLVATAVTEMVATVDEIANNTHEAANKAETTHHNAENGKTGVESTIAQIDQLSNTLLESEHIVQELAKDSDTIGSVLDVIRGIAEQTNLLALNAAIEAARAGEQGRGFAVVADEVRTLASRTQDSTQEIEGIISSLQTRTKDIVSHMAACRTQGQESAEQAASAGGMLEEITHDVSTIMEMNTAIATAIQEQSTVASEVNQHVVMIRDVAESSGKAALQNGEMSEELSAQADVLNREVNQFKV